MCDKTSNILCRKLLKNITSLNLIYTDSNTHKKHCKKGISFLIYQCRLVKSFHCQSELIERPS